MRRLQRKALSPEAESFLNKRTTTVTSAANPKKKAELLWRSRKAKAFKEIQRNLRQMASGIERCMYCEDSSGTDIEHFWPKSTYPTRAFTWTNYLWACSHCNSNEKRTAFPLDTKGQPLLIDPTNEDPLTFLTYSPATGRFQPKSKKGTLAWKKPNKAASHSASTDNPWSKADSTPGLSFRNSCLDMQDSSSNEKQKKPTTCVAQSRSTHSPAYSLPCFISHQAQQPQLSIQPASQQYAHIQNSRTGLQ
ncbi:retron system putative HNH endonuclease [Corallococcus exiguus]|uniref:retron system putative HNH endonuclease n=1 Tax=Corallococcus exiguus TaxID=83462 RepID=UPI003DA3A53E